ncbi:unnamed protein product [Clavelina lepadiformis]|uniref:Uncharacterized protein n=1 Tax=Clavelina lepadiformis TaxID=159417 RepID=A0ABP0EVH0_CLALP
MKLPLRRDILSRLRKVLRPKHTMGFCRHDRCFSVFADLNNNLDQIEDEQTTGENEANRSIAKKQPDFHKNR